MRFLLPAQRPGIYSPAVYRGVRDGDTILFRLPMLGDVAIRLMDVSCPELTERGGKKAMIVADELLRHSDADLQVFLDLPRDRDQDGRITLVEVLKKATFDRWPGTCFIDHHDIRQLLIERRVAKWAPYE